MKKIIHLSDLHFGTEKPELVQALVENIHQLQPDMIIVSGDLTQRAKHQQFARAKQFLQQFSQPILCVPGNHDIGLYRLVERFLYPFAKYKQWISPTLCTHLIQDNVAILGINSVTPFKPMGGFVTDKQLSLVEDFFKQQQDKIKIIVMHHNLILSERHKIINDAEKIITVFAACHVDLVLSGHIHSANVEKITRSYFSHPMYVITAGTAISNRTIAPNSFNVIEIDDNQFQLTVKAYQSRQFIAESEAIFKLR